MMEEKEIYIVIAETDEEDLGMTPFKQYFVVSSDLEKIKRRAKSQHYGTPRIAKLQFIDEGDLQ